MRIIQNANMAVSGSFHTAAVSLLIMLIAHSVWAADPSGIPDRDFTIWGTAYVDDVALTRDDTGHTVSLRLDGGAGDLASYAMGSEPVYEDWYVLRIPMSIGATVSGSAHTGDTAYIYIDDLLIAEAYLEPAHQSISLPITIGNPAETIRMNIYQVIAGDPPVASDLLITPGNPRTTDDLMGGYTYDDSEQNPESDLTEIRWYKDDQLQSAYDNTLVVSSSGTARGQAWHFTVKPHDGYQFGTVQASNTVIIGNTEPVASDPYISPASPLTDDDLTGEYNYSDIDDDPEDGSEIRWYMNGDVQAGYNDISTLPSSATAKGQQWYFTVRPGDGTDFGPIQTSGPVIVTNSQPAASNPLIYPALPLTGDDLMADYVYSDPDGDPESGTTIRWYKNGNIQSVYNDEKIVPSSGTVKGQQWRFTVRPGDGTVIGSYQTSPTVTIGNTPPVADAGGPYEDLPGEVVIFDGSGSYDADDDPLISYSWDFGDDSAGAGENPSHLYSEPGLYIVTLIVNDGAADSAPSITTAYIDDDPSGTPSAPINMAIGWNLISIPREPSDTSIDSVLFSIQGKYDSILTYDATTGVWLKHTVGGPPFSNSLSEVRPGVGYWVKMGQTGVLVVQGTQPVTAVWLEKGWNLVGYNLQTSRAIENCMYSIVGKYNSVYTYDPDEREWLRYVADGPPSLNNLKFMQPGKGYLIDAKEGCVWDAGL